MADIIQLKTAKYKGVEFLYESMTTTFGNRIIKFNYPGSDKQSIERQGQLPRDFAMNAIIPHDGYFEKRDNLMRVLEDGEPGTLTHPTFGDVANVVNGKCTLVEKITTLGRAAITISFAVDDASGVPQESGNLAAQVQALTNDLNAQLSADIEDGYNADKSLTGVFSDALDNVGQAIDAISDAADNLLDPITENVSAFRRSITNVTGKIGDLVQAPAELGAAIDGLFADLNNLASAPGDLLNAFEALFNFGDDDPVIAPTTVAIVQRTSNRALIRANLRTKALSYSYLNASEDEYPTTDELDAAQDTLEVQYLDSRASADPVAAPSPGLAPSAPALSNASLEILDRVRVQAQKTLDVERVNTRSILLIETPLIPLSVLVYSFYGSTELVGTIADLNNITQNAFVEGDLKILTA